MHHAYAPAASALVRSMSLSQHWATQLPLCSRTSVASVPGVGTSALSPTSVSKQWSCSRGRKPCEAFQSSCAQEHFRRRLLKDIGICSCQEVIQGSQMTLSCVLSIQLSMQDGNIQYANQPLAVNVDEIELVTKNVVNMIFRFNRLFYILHIFVDHVFFSCLNWSGLDQEFSVFGVTVSNKSGRWGLKLQNENYKWMPTTIDSRSSIRYMRYLQPCSAEWTCCRASKLLGPTENYIRHYFFHCAWLQMKLLKNTSRKVCSSVSECLKVQRSR